MPSNIKDSGCYTLTIDKNNVSSLEGVLDSLVKRKFKRVLFRLTEDKNILIKYSEVKPFIEKAIQKYKWILPVYLVNFPFCLFRDYFGHIIFEVNKPLRRKSSHCFLCRYDSVCRGVGSPYAERFGFGELEAQLSLPLEVMIEVEPKCNFNCRFCFNKVSFASSGRNIENKLNIDYLKKVIKRVKEIGIKSIKLTGGEPLLRNDLFEILEYAKEVGIERIRLNSNGYLIDNKNAPSLVKYVDSFLISVESSMPEREDLLSGRKNVLARKLEALRLLREAGAKHISVGTVIRKDLAQELSQLEDLLDPYQVDAWSFFRPMPIESNLAIFSKDDMKNFLKKFISLAKKTSKFYVIANAFPFCIHENTDEINLLSYGAIYDDGHAKFVIDPRGFVKPHYFINENIGNPLTPLGCWHHPFMKSMRRFEYVPEGCRKCLYLGKCRGGSRAAAKIIRGSYNALDPLIEEAKPVLV